MRTCPAPADLVTSGNTVDAVWEVGGLDAEAVATHSFGSELDSVRAARHFTADLFDRIAGGAAAESAAIVVTELAANAVLHARSGFTLTISRSAAAVRIAVRDNGPLVQWNHGRPFDVKKGHGLSVVAQLARAWAVERLPEGKVVWAELPIG
jgi:anti-sigma regulatory factor (Ser/Thr protein kinase)